MIYVAVTVALILAGVYLIRKIQSAKDAESARFKEKRGLAMEEGRAAAKSGLSEMACPYEDGGEPPDTSAALLAFSSLALNDREFEGQRYWWLAGYRDEIKVIVSRANTARARAAVPSDAQSQPQMTINDTPNQHFSIPREKLLQGATIVICTLDRYAIYLDGDFQNQCLGNLIIVDNVNKLLLRSTIMTSGVLVFEYVVPAEHRRTEEDLRQWHTVRFANLRFCVGDEPAPEITYRASMEGLCLVILTWIPPDAPGWRGVHSDQLQRAAQLIHRAVSG